MKLLLVILGIGILSPLAQQPSTSNERGKAMSHCRFRRVSFDYQLGNESDWSHDCRHSLYWNFTRTYLEEEYAQAHRCRTN